MALSDNIREKISIEVIKTLLKRFENFPEDASNNRNAPFHEAFLKAFSDKLEDKVSDIPIFISLASWLHGLNTTLGQSFFENVAHYLCDGEKREYTQGKRGIQKIKQTQKNNVNSIITNLKNSICSPDVLNENNQLFKSFDSPDTDALGFSADVYYETDEEIIAIELKSVKPNSGEMKGEKQKILEGKAVLYQLSPHKTIRFYIGFPFDPTADLANGESTTSYNKDRFFAKIIDMNRFFAHDETLVASELWDFLSGTENTMEEILEIINTISTTKFLSKFQLLIDNSKRNTPEYLSQLQEWNLFSEQELIENYDLIQRRLTTRSLKRNFNKTAFDSEGNYKYDRYNILKTLIRN
ncbi:MAG: TdeIII family type II restriction endonuclease [Dysgonamonadaceae bacterium]|jgi:hypothetical protein|nr:TdeIII family type II restriction endonuclease [Dysgonamonadaceae bacterium]